MTTKLYSRTTTVSQWYGSSVTIPAIDSKRFYPFATSCMGIVATLLEKKTEKRIRVGLSNTIDTAYADPDKSLIVISERFLSGNFGSVGVDKNLSATKTIGAILGVIVHEVGHFAYSPKDLSNAMAYIEARTTKHYNAPLAKRIANTLEDIYIEYRISKVAPTLAWSLDEINKLMLTEVIYKNSIKSFKKTTSVSNPVVNNAVLNFLLFAKITSDSGKVSPYVKNLFSLARSVVKLDTITDRYALALKLYDIFAIESVSNLPLSSSNQSVATEDNDQDDNDTESDDYDQEFEDDQETDSEENDTEDDTEATEEPEDDQTESDDTEDDQESEDAIENDSDDLDSVDSEDDTEDDTEDSESEDTESTSGSSDEAQDQESDDQESEDQETTGLGKGQSTEDDLSNLPLEIPSIGAYESDATEPVFNEIEPDTTIRSMGLDGHKIEESVMPSDNYTTLEMDKRYTRLSQVALQRASANILFSEQQRKGRQMRQLRRIVTDQKIFTTRLETDTLQPMEIIILLDCSGSMVQWGNNKLLPASMATLGAATGLVNGRCIVSVYGHTADRVGATKTVNIYGLMRHGESPTTLAKRLAYLNRRQPCSYNRDGYALHEIAKKFSPQKRKKVILVISDGAPNGSDWSYDGMHAQKHTRDMVTAIRASGIDVYSLSIDTEAYHANNYIYGQENNVCNTDPNAIDTMIRDLFLK